MIAKSLAAYPNATAAPARTTGNDQAQSPKYVTAAAATTQPPKKPRRRWSEPINRFLSSPFNDWVCDTTSSRDSTEFVKLPVMTAVDGATGRVSRKRVN